MVRFTALAVGMIAVAVLTPQISAQVNNSPGSSESEKSWCTASHWHDDSRVSYAEVREQTLTQASLNKIRPSMNGGAKIHGWAKQGVLVKACIQTSAPTDAEARRLASQVSIARGPGDIAPDGPKIDQQNYWGVSYEIWMPVASDIDVSSMNGGLTLDAVHGQIHFECMNGGVHLTHLGGDVNGSTVNGGIRIELAGNRWEGKGMHVSTTNGGVHIDVPAAYSANFESSTVNGGLHCDFPVTVQGRHTKNLAIQTGSGGALIHASTVNGGIHISRTA